MVLWRDRPAGYKIGFSGLSISIVAYVIGFSVPYWSLLNLKDYGYVDQTIGLWHACIHESLTCVSNVHGSNPAWMNAARALCSVAVILFCISLLSGCFRNATRSGQISCEGTGRHVEGCAIIATIVGAVGCIIYAAEFHRIYVYAYDVGHLYWAFGLVCGALGVAGICACVMFAFNRQQNLRQRRATTVRARGPNGFPVSIQFPVEMGEDRVHIPYFGDVMPNHMVLGASPMQPPSYEMVTTGYSKPPTDVTDAPPLYEDITKNSVLPPEVVAHLLNENKDSEQSGSGNQS
ncbi:uncharacterized protein [Littorina saxatilis]|uniref:Uncharacterized protein n=1 Tax=Littorina saxatilis TaxID=31220 RepID=A0AAN9FYR0_9CAEN